MGHVQLTGVLTHLRRTIDAHGPTAPTDGELLERFVTARDQGAFELLVWRHGTMVLHACRRLLARPEDAEDAFQATFLALVRQAGGIGRREAVAGWLHKVACRIALRVRAQSARRAACERQYVALPDQAHDSAGLLEGGLDPVLWTEVRHVVDGEVNRLPTKLRAAFVLCCLEGLTNEEAARQLGCPKGTVLSRLARARERLRGRLARRGFTISVGALAAALSQEAVSSAASVSLVASTLKAGLLVAAGHAMTAVVASPIAALTEGVLQAMFMQKVKIVMAVIVGVGLAVGGAGGWMYQTQAAGPGETPLRKSAQNPAAPAAPKNESPQEKAKAQADIDRAVIQLEQLRQLVAKAEAELGVSKAKLDAAKGEFENARKNFEATAPQGKPKLYLFEMRNKPWSNVFVWVADNTGLPFVSEIPPPTGTFSYVAPRTGLQPKMHTMPEIIDLINEALAAKKLILIRRPSAFTLATADDRIRNNEFAPQQGVAPAKVGPTEQPAPLPKNAEPAKTPNLPVGAQTDLIQLASAYVDAVRDLQTAKAKLRPSKKLSQEDVDIGEINLVSADRKVELLKAIVEGAIQSAEGELRDAKRFHQAGFDGAGRVTAAESKLRVLKLILGSNK